MDYKDVGVVPLNYCTILICVQSCPMATPGNEEKGLYEVLSSNEEHQENTIYCSIPK